MKPQRSAATEPAAAAKRGALKPLRTFALAKTAAKAVTALTVAGVLAACGSTPMSPGSGDSARTSPGASGITVFGDIDMGVTRQRSR